MQRLQFNRRRMLLLVIAAAVFMFDMIWLFHLHPTEQTQFRLESTTGAVVEMPGAAPLPIFSRKDGHWSVKGQPVSDLSSYLVDPDPQKIGPDSTGPYITVQLPSDATTANYRDAIADLAKQGICQVAIIQRSGSTKRQEANVMRIKEVRQQDGSMSKCFDRTSRNYRPS